jgi:cellulose biosynthesis protein BcsQ
MVALFTFKGGVGKTTLTELLAQTLARIGFTVLVVDGDRQMNITTFFKGDPPKPQLSPEAGRRRQ